MKIAATIILGISFVVSVIHATFITAEHASMQTIEEQMRKRDVNVVIDPKGNVSISSDVSTLDRKEYQDLVEFLKDSTVIIDESL